MRCVRNNNLLQRRRNTKLFTLLAIPLKGKRDVYLQTTNNIRQTTKFDVFSYVSVSTEKVHCHEVI